MAHEKKMARTQREQNDCSAESKSALLGRCDGFVYERKGAIRGDEGRSGFSLDDCPFHSAEHWVQRSEDGAHEIESRRFFHRQAQAVRFKLRAQIRANLLQDELAH